MPTLNDAEYIERAVESILDQSHSDFELMIIDDGSTDGTVERIKQFSDERLSLVQREDETGVASARNEGIRRTSGEYIAVHDADDWSDPERFEKQVAYLDANPEVALVGTGAYLVDKNGNIQSQRRVLESPSLAELVDHNEFVHGSVMMRREALEFANGYDGWFETAEDYDLWLRIAADREVRNIDEPLYYFRKHENSLYIQNLKSVKLYHLLAVRRVSNGLDETIQLRINKEGIATLYNELNNKEHHWFHTELAREFIRYGELTPGREHALNALRINPVSVTLWAMLFLTVTAPSVAVATAHIYRKILNIKIKLQNR